MKYENLVFLLEALFEYRRVETLNTTDLGNSKILMEFRTFFSMILNFTTGVQRVHTESFEVRMNPTITFT